MMQPSMPIMPPAAFDEEAYRSQLIADRDQKDAKRRKEGLEAYKRQKVKLDKERSKSAIMTVVACDVIGSITLIVCLFRHDWIYIAVNGSFIKQLHIEIGMFDINAIIHCGKNVLEDWVCVKLLRFNGHKSLQQFLGLVCSVASSRTCQEIDNVVTANWVMICAVGFCVVCEIISIVCVLFYWNQDHDSRWRRKSYMIGLLGAGIMALGFPAWAVMMPDMGNLPQNWFMWGNVGGVQIVGWPPVPALPLGNTLYIALLATFILMATNISLGMNLVPHPEELDDEAMQERMELLEDQLQLARGGGVPDYGAGATQTPMIGGNNADFGIYNQKQFSGPMVPYGGMIR